MSPFKKLYGQAFTFVATAPLLAALTEQEKQILLQNQRQIDKGYGGTSSAILEFGKRAFGTTNIPQTPMQIISAIITVLLGLLGFITFGIILIAGYKWITSTGDPKKIQEAKAQILQATIGLVVVLSAYAIANFIISAVTTATTVSP